MRTAEAIRGPDAPDQPPIPTKTRPAVGISPELTELWQRFKENADPQAREQLIVHYAPRVKYVASRVATGLPANVEQADLVSYGIFGLIDALEKFDLSREIKFETYSIPGSAARSSTSSGRWIGSRDLSGSRPGGREGVHRAGC